MTEADAIEAIEQRWLDIWRDSLHPEIPFTLENEKFTGVDLWARVSVQHTVSQQHTQGGPGTRRWIRNGNIWVQLFGNVDNGRKPLSSLVADIRRVYEGVSLPASGGEPLTCVALTSRESPTDNRWYMLTTLTAFYYFETR